MTSIDLKGAKRIIRRYPNCVSLEIYAWRGAPALRIGRYARMGLMTAARRRRSMSIWTRLVFAIAQRDGAAAAALHAQLSLENRTAALEEFRKSKDGGPQPAGPPLRARKRPLSTEYAA